MALKYVYSAAAGSADGSSWANAYTTGPTALAAGAAGDDFPIADDHSESGASGVWTFPGTAASPNRMYSARRSGGSVPPVDADLRTTSVAVVTGSGNAVFAGYAYIEGVIFTAGSTTGTGGFTFGASGNPWYFRFKNCKLRTGGTGSNVRITLGATTGTDDQRLELINTTIRFAAASHGIIARAPLVWRGGGIESGGVAPTILFPPANGVIVGEVLCEGLDLSALGSGCTLVDVSGITVAKFTFRGCKLGSGVALTTGAVAGQGGVEVEVDNCSSGDIHNFQYKQNYQGFAQTETTVVRTGGASDGTTTISHKMVSTANAKFYSPLRSFWIPYYNATVGSPITADIPIVNDGSTLTDAEVWGEVMYQGTSGFPQTTFADDAAATILTTGTSQTADVSSTWTTTGLSSPVKQKLSVTFTPQEIGRVWVRVCLAKPSTTIYVDPKVLSGSGRQYMIGNGLYVNEGAAGGGSAVFPAAGKVHTSAGAFGPNGNDITPTRTDAAAAYVLTTATPYGDPGAPTSGLATLPTAAKVLTTQADFGVSGALTTPTYVPVAAADVVAGVLFGPASSLTGLYSASGGITLSQLQGELVTLLADIGSTLDDRGLTELTGPQNFIQVDFVEMNGTAITESTLPTAADVAAIATAVADLATTVAAVDTKVTTLAGYVDTEVATILTAVGTTIPALIDLLPTNSELATALGTADDAMLAAITTVNGNVVTVNTNIGTVLTRLGTPSVSVTADIAGVNTAVGTKPSLAQILAGGDVDGYTLEETLKLILAVAAGKMSGAATNTSVFRAADDSKARVTATTAATGRTAVTLDATG